MKNWWRNRDVIMILSVFCGLLGGNGAAWTQPLVLPALAVVMTLSTTGGARRYSPVPPGLVAPGAVGSALELRDVGGGAAGTQFFPDFRNRHSRRLRAPGGSAAGHRGHPLHRLFKRQHRLFSPGHRGLLFGGPGYHPVNRPGVARDRLHRTTVADPGNSGVDFGAAAPFPAIAAGPPWPRAWNPSRGPSPTGAFFWSCTPSWA